jgi:hypothetical protein
VDFLAAVFVTIVIEIIALYLLYRRKFDGVLIARNAVIASMLTLPFVWFFFPIFGLKWEVQIAISEIFAVVVEALVYNMLFHRMRFSEALLASVVCNWASFIVGLMIG